jgi:GntR family transcriptional regulator, transcriptional repressor for pyruvate dehydrogenase complex
MTKNKKNDSRKLKMKKEDVLDRLLWFVKEQKFQKGDKLPPERELAEELNTSRATIRETLRRLEERGIVKVKRSSGVFLNKSTEVIDLEQKFPPQDEETLIKDQLEVHFLFLPLLVGCAAARANDEEIRALQGCIVTMSRAIVAKDLDTLSEADNEFHRLLAIMTKNRNIFRIIQVLNSGREVFWEYFIKNDEFIHNVIFAGYVELVNCIKNRDPEASAKRAKRNILNIGERIPGLKNLQLHEIIELTEKINRSK